jgi:hypothetical protein
MPKDSLNSTVPVSPTLDPTVAIVPSSIAAPQLRGQYHQPNSTLVVNMLQELNYLVTHWQRELITIEQEIAVIQSAGPIVAGWLEPAKDSTPLKVDYQLCSFDEIGQLSTRDCPPPEMLGISQSVARHRQLEVLIDRQKFLEAKIKHILAGLVQLRIDID